MTPKYVLEARIKTAEKEVKKLKNELSELNKSTVRDHLEIVWSRDHTAYYLTDGFNMPRMWMSAAFTEGEMTPEERDKGGFGPGTVQISCKRTGKVYTRKIWHFSFWNIKSDPQHEKVEWPAFEDVSDKSRLIGDYVLCSVQHDGWKGWENER